MKPADKKFLKNLGKQIRKFREEQGISQDQLAFECEMHRTNINRIEKGKISVGVARLNQIAKTLGVTFSKLVEFTEKKVE
ncbi:MAG: helix-turn-helix transcriptional regulator [Bacteroidetes bacterium]|nr:helix-turn-helix transcriptional regulator [Bacteroidota bacterium]